MKQQRIDFTRSEQLAIIRRFSAKFKGVKPTVQEGQKRVAIAVSALVAVLRCVDDHAGQKSSCWASQETMATETGLSVRHVKRSMKYLENNGLVSVKRRQRDTSIVKPVFHNLDKFDPSLKCHSGSLKCHRSNLEVPQKHFRSATVAYRSAVEAPKEAPLRRSAGNVGVERRINFLSQESIAGNFESICKRVPISKPNDIWLVNRIAALVVQRRISEADLANVLETIDCIVPRNPVAYLRSGIVRRCFGDDDEEFEKAIRPILIEKPKRITARGNGAINSNCGHNEPTLSP